MKKLGVRGSARSRKRNFGVEVHVHANDDLKHCCFVSTSD